MTLSFAIGATASIYSVADALLVRPLPFQGSGRLVHVGMVDPSESDGSGSLSPADFEVLTARRDVFRTMAVSVVSGRKMLGSGANTEELAGREISPELFELAGIHPAVGRQFLPSDAESGAPRTLMLSERLWRRRFGGRPDAVGSSVTLSGHAYEIIGIMPLDWGRADDSDFWMPYRLAEDRDNRTSYLDGVLARLQTGVSLARAQAAVALLSRSLETAHPESNRGLVIRLVPIRRHLVGEFWTPLLVLVGAVAFVLLTACANVANLLLSRAARRQRETAIRQALGASRRALVRESVAEACLLSLAGATLSIPVAWSLTRLLRAFGPDEIWQFPAISTNWRVLASCAGLAVVTGLAIGLLSGFWGSRTAPEVFLRAGGTGSRQPFARRGLGSAFLIAEVALAFPLMIGSGLMIQSLWRLGHANLGFRTDGLSVAQIWLLRYRYPEERERREFFGRVLDGVRRTPGVEAVGLISNEPVGPFGLENRPYRIDGKETPVEESPEASFKVVDPGYLDTLGVPLLRGRPLSVLDDDRAPPVALVSASLGSRLALADPIGSMIQVRFPKRWETVRIVGVVGDVASWPEARSGPTIYMSYRQRVVPPISLVFRSRLTRMGADRAIREVVRAVDPDQLVRRVEPMSELLDRALTTSRFVAFLLETFAALALALAAVGTYSVTSYLVAQRRAEIGIRTALGACRRDVLSLFVGQSLRRAAVGVLLGLVAALVLTRFLEGLLFDVTSMDTPTLLGGVAVLLSAGTLGAYFPARAAARLDPVTALRAE